MKENATIFVKGVQTVDGDSSQIEFSSEGTIERREKGIRLTYHELTDEGQSAQTTLTVLGNSVRIEREGSNEMTMSVHLGQRRSCSLATPMGALLIGTYGTHFSHEGCRLKLCYDLDMNSVLMSQNELEIEYIIDK